MSPSSIFQIKNATTHYRGDGVESLFHPISLLAVALAASTK
jgi:hypothetical protein